MHIKEKLMNIQVELKAPKSQRNDFGGFNYRKLEDILEGLKPLFSKYKVVLTIDNELQVIGERLFRKSIATLNDIESDDKISTTMFTQESIDRKGMTAEMCSGSSASYGDKYCLNKLFCLDDSVDPDSTNTKEEKKESKAKTGTVPSFSKNNTF